MHFEDHPSACLAPLWVRLLSFRRMEKIDYKKALSAFYRASAKQVVDVDVPKMRFLMIDGHGDPGVAAEYKAALEALYPVAFGLKFLAKKGDLAIDYGVMPLQGLWWADDMNDFINGRRDRWLWTLMIMQPEFISEAMFEEVCANVRAKKAPGRLGDIRLDGFDEGPAAQILHVGPYSEEGPTIQRIHEHIESHGHQLSGKHHEIYLGDPRKSAPERLKTILRQPWSAEKEPN